MIERLRERVAEPRGLKVSDKPWEAVEPYLLDGLDVFVGAESLVARGLERGAAGAVSGLASAFPEVVAALVHEPSARARRRGRAAADRARPVPLPGGREGASPRGAACRSAPTSAPRFAPSPPTSSRGSSCRDRDRRRRRDRRQHCLPARARRRDGRRPLRPRRRSRAARPSRAMGGVRQQFSTAAEVRLARESIAFFDELGPPVLRPGRLPVRRDDARPASPSSSSGSRSRRSSASRSSGSIRRSCPVSRSTTCSAPSSARRTASPTRRRSRGSGPARRRGPGWRFASAPTRGASLAGRHARDRLRPLVGGARSRCRGRTADPPALPPAAR